MDSQNTSIQKKVFTVIRKIPRGKVVTYKGVAKAIGNPLASRAVGNALHRNPHPIQIPCHRVVKSDGTLGGYALGEEKKKQLLENEGVIFTDKNKIDVLCIVRNLR